MLDPFWVWKGRLIDLLEAATESRQGADVRFYRRPAEILQQVVVQVNAVPAGLTRKDLMEIGQVIIDKMGKRLRWVHAWSQQALATSDA